MSESESEFEPESDYHFKVLEQKYMRKYVEMSDGTKAWLYNYEMFAITVDLIVFDPTLNYVMLIKRGANTEPVQFRHRWAIPGGFLNRDETSVQGAAREYHEETGQKVDEKNLIFVCVADDPYRDPRQRTMSMVYTATADIKCNPLVTLDADEIDGVQWVLVSDLLGYKLPMAFDHHKLLAQALLKQKELNMLKSYSELLLKNDS